MSEHRRKPPQSRGRRAAAPSGRRAATPSGSPGVAGDRPYGSRAEARRAMRRGGGGRRRAASAAEGAGRRGRRRAEYPARRRIIDYPRADYDGLRRWVPSWKQVLGTVIAGLGLMVGLVGIAYAMVEVPDPNKMATQQKNVYYWADGSRMVVSGGGDINRQIIPLSEIPEAMQDAVIAAENASFRSDPGIDPVGIGRAVVNMARGGEVQSGSTITQQLVKNMYLDQSQTLSRKVKELLISVKVGAEVSKDEILEGYLNTSYFGRGTYGLQAAAQAYYNKDASELDPSECAFLTALLKGPELYDPSGGSRGESAAAANKQRAMERWEWVLDRRVEVGTLSAADRAQYTEFPMPHPPSKDTEKAGQIGYLTELADNYLSANDIVSEKDLARGGHQIYTTFDKKKVDKMEAAVKSIMDKNIDPKARDEDRFVQFGGASVVPGDGAIVAIYGGVDWTKHFLNNADNPMAQVGSTFKPFVLAAALRDGVRDPDKGPEQDTEDRTVVSPESVYKSKDGLLIRNYDGTVWKGEDPETGEEFELRQANFEGQSQGDVTLREAMEVSANSPFVQLGMDVGPATVAQAAIDAGLREDSLGPADDTVPSFALGVSTPGPIRMATAYATFAASGEQAEPYSVTKVENAQGTLYEHETETRQAFDSSVADNVTDVLSSVVKSDVGSGHRAEELGKPVAAKTGTTDDNKSAWFAGFTPHLSTAIGMWRMPESEDELKPGEKMGFQSMYGTGGLERINGSSLPLDVWLAYMKGATAGDPGTEFPEPPELGEEIYGGGAKTPEPTPTEDPQERGEQERAADEKQRPGQEEGMPPVEETPSPAPTCEEWDWTCDPSDPSTGGDSTGTDGGDTSGTDAGTDAGTDTEGTDTEGADTDGTDEGNGNNGSSQGDGGAIFGRGG